LEEATWEEENVMAGQFPSPNLGDMVVSQGVDIDGDTNKVKTWRVFENRYKNTSLTLEMAKNHNWKPLPRICASTIGCL
jgi:hypothetical protein